MDFVRHLQQLDSASVRFAELAGSADLTASVPSCPDWTVADLVHHLAGVQHFWAEIVGGLRSDPDGVEQLARPDHAAMAAGFADASVRLGQALRSRKPSDSCWSWSDRGGTVEWVARRQHHEAAIHLADLELAAFGHTEVPDPASALDGIDEILDVMLDDFPAWMTYEPKFLVDIQVGTITKLMSAGRLGDERLLTVGSLSGTSPDTGTSYQDLPGARRAEYGQADATLRGPAGALYLWLWGRGSLDPIDVDGDVAAAQALRAAIADGTQ